jgi:uncharacterized MAPEG superfamily protein
MTQALWCVLIAGLLPYAAALTAKIGGQDFSNADPRGWLARQEGFRHRANSAQLNSFEAFPFFATAVLVAEFLNAPRARVDALAAGFIVARAAYLGCYLGNLPALRSLAWFAGLACIIALFVVSASVSTS